MAADNFGPASEIQSFLRPAGVQAQHIDRLWWPTLWTLVVVYLLTVLMTVLAVARQHRSARRDRPKLLPAAERRLGFGVGISLVLTTIILCVILLGDFTTDVRQRALSRQSAFMVVRVTGHQWWWEFTYQDPQPSRTLTDANELHIPVGQTVRLDLQSNDVIHSFWVPNLGPKKDLIPGHPTSIWLRADQPGVYWGQCSEFCGHQHAHMRFAVVAQPTDSFERWRNDALQPAREPTTDLQSRGRNVFLAQTCSMCHAIGGTQAASHVGPDLTHIASRISIAGGSLPNTMGHLGGWIADPQSIKPGVLMPQHNLSGDDLQALLEYLGSLR